MDGQSTPQALAHDPTQRPSAIAHITQAALVAVQEPAFLDQLASQLANRLLMSKLQPTAIPLQELGNGHVVVEPKATKSGKVVVLTQVPIIASTNIHLVLLIKDHALLELPREEGREIEPYAMVMYIDQIPGDLKTRKVFGFSNDEEDIQDELNRQLRTLELGPCAFFYLNIVQLPEQVAA